MLQGVGVITGEMVSKRYTITALALGMLLMAGQPNLRQRVAAQAKSFHQSFEALKIARNTISPFERVVFSLALAGAAESK